MRKIFSIVILLTVTVVLSAELILNHDPIQTIQKGKKVNIRLDVLEGIEDIKEVILFYRQQDELAYNEMEIEMTSVTDPYIKFLIQDTDRINTGIEYFFQIRTKNNQMQTLPVSNPQISPFLITVLQPQQQVDSDKFILLSPDIDYTDFSRNFVIAISFFSIQNKIDPAEIKFFLNNEDQTSQAEIYKNMLIYKVSDFPGGEYSYQIKAKLKDGLEIKSSKWRMTIVDKSWKSDLSLTGKSIVNTYYFKRNSDNDDDVDKRANMLLTLQGKYNWLDFRSKLYFSSLETHKEQAVNRYNLTFLTNFIDITIGDNSPNYSAFQLSGTNVRGFHSNLHFRNFRLKFTGGKSNRAIKGDSQYEAGQFATNTYSLRTEFGKPDGVMLSLGFTKNKDDVDSIDDDYIFAADSSFVVEPQDNIVLGSDISLALFKRRLLMGAEIAMSYLNRNIYDGPMSIEDIEEELDTELDLPIDPEDLEPILVINENLEPFTPGLKNMAYKAFMRTYFYHNFLNVNYSAVGSSFNSLSSNYLQTDTSVLGINDNINLFKNKLNLNLSINLISDNLNNEKDSTTRTSNYNTQLFYRITSDLNFRTAFSQNTTDREGGDTGSTILSFGTSYQADQIKKAPTRFSLNFMQYKNDYSYDYTIDDSTTIVDYDYTKNNFSFSANSDWQSLPLDTEFSMTISVADKKTSSDENPEENENISTTYNSLYLKAIYSLLDEKLRPYCDLQYNIFGGDDDKNSTLFNLGAFYQVLDRTFISTNLGTKFYSDNKAEENDYTTLTWRFKIVQKF